MFMSMVSLQLAHHDSLHSQATPIPNGSLNAASSPRGSGLGMRLPNGASDIMFTKLVTIAVQIYTDLELNSG